MNIRQQKKVNNQYLTKRDVEVKSSYYLKEQSRIEKEVLEHERKLSERPPFNKEIIRDTVLENFVKDNINLVEIENNYFNKIFLENIESLPPKEFLELDEELSSVSSRKEFFDILSSRTSFNLNFLDDLDPEKDFNISMIPIIREDKAIVLENERSENEINEKLPFEMTWFKNPFVVLSRYKVGNTRENIKQIISYISYDFDTPITYDKDLKEFIYVSNPLSTKRKSRKEAKRKKVYIEDYQEKYNQRYLFSSKGDSFYAFIFEKTEKVVLGDRMVSFELNDPQFSKIVIFY